jgi:hypothetical protein
MGMSPTIRISQETYEHLQAHAEPFVDTPDLVIRRLLGIDLAEEKDLGAQGRSGANLAATARASDDEPGPNALKDNGGGSPKQSISAPAHDKKPRRRRQGAAKRGARAPRAPRGSLMNDAAYELPILQALAERGGRAGKNEVLDALEPLLTDKLTELDRAQIASGEIRWRNRAQFVRLRLVERGEMQRGSPRGIWELTEAGQARLEEAGVGLRSAAAR